MSSRCIRRWSRTPRPPTSSLRHPMRSHRPPTTRRRSRRIPQSGRHPCCPRGEERWNRPHAPRACSLAFAERFRPAIFPKLAARPPSIWIGRR
uniref:Uncharacterized protein n=1 Tax=Arundo donax TaxID=35708 RepID=A0A0A9FY85_ARUDO